MYSISDNCMLCRLTSFWYLISCYRRGCLLLYLSSQLPLLLLCILSRAFSFHCLGLKGVYDFGLICFCFPLATPFFFILFTRSTWLWSWYRFLYGLGGPSSFTFIYGEDHNFCNPTCISRSFQLWWGFYAAELALRW